MANPKAQLLVQNYQFMKGWVNMYLKTLSEEDLRKELLPGKNHGVWILGHLISSDDDLSSYLGKGPPLFPEYQELFKQGSDLKAFSEYPPVSVLRKQWRQVCDKNEKMLKELTDEELSHPHAFLKGKMEDDYFKTKEGCVLNWALHQVHHAGQLAVLVAKTGHKRLV